MPNTRLELLFNRFISRESTEAEKAELMQLLAVEANEAQAGELFEQAWHSFTPVTDTLPSSGDLSPADETQPQKALLSRNGPFTPDQSREIWRRIFSTIQKTGIRPGLFKRIEWRRAAVAAAILVFLIAGAW